MASKPFAARIKRNALAVALGLCFASGVQAQTNTAGAVNGRAVAGDTITLTNPASGYSRTVTVGSDGTYRFAQVPTGQYQISRNGEAPRDVPINVGTTSNVDFVTADTTTLGAVTVIGTGINPIDVSSVESTTVLTEAQIDRLPVARDTTSMALLAPGTTLGDSRLGSDQAQSGKLASFGGSSVAENVYYINGFNVTNIVNGVAFSELPFEAISETQVKNGGYGAEFGRSLGGVVNVIGKRGSNEWHFGGNVIWSPGDMRGDSLRYIPNPTVYYDGPDDDDIPEWQRMPTVGDWIAVENPNNYEDSLLYNLYASGPIVRENSPPAMKIDIERPMCLPPNSPTSATAGAWNMADERPETSSSSRTTAKFGAMPMDERETAAVASFRARRSRIDSRGLSIGILPPDGEHRLGITRSLRRGSGIRHDPLEHDRCPKPREGSKPPRRSIAPTSHQAIPGPW